MNTRTNLASLLLIAAAFGSGCASEESVEASNEDLRVREGYTQLLPDSERSVYGSIAVKGDKAYLGRNDRSVDVVNLGTMKVTKSFKQIPNNGSLAMAGDTLVACSLEDEDPLESFLTRQSTGDANNFVVSFVNPSNGAIKHQLRLRLQAFLRESEGYNLPHVGCRVSGEKLFISLAKENIQHEILEFPMPEASATYDFPEALPRDVVRTKVGRTGRESSICGFTPSASGFALAACGYGVESLKNGRVKSLTSSRDQFFVDVLQTGDTLLAVETGALLSLNPETGRELAPAVPINDSLQAIAVDGAHLFVAGARGVYVGSKPR